jgi:hypothetical protein
MILCIENKARFNDHIFKNANGYMDGEQQTKKKQKSDK